LISVQAGPDFIPPLIWNLEHYPESPEYNEIVNVSANATDEETSMGPVILSYYNGSEWTNATMNLEDDQYSGVIPALPYGKSVSYKVYASDDVGNWAETDISDYTVVDSIPPSIMGLELNPQGPSSGESVVVSTTASEPLFASGLEKVTLWWRTDGTELQSSRMLQEDGLWKATIPGQSSDTLVEFFIEAYDNEGNRATSGQSNYTVSSGEAAQWWQSPLLIGIIVAVAVSIGVLIYLVKFKRQRTKSR